MKKLTKNILKAINPDIPALTEDSEGKLHGGFVEPDDPFGLPGLKVNIICGNSDCTNYPCTNPSCMNKICPTTTTTEKPGVIGNTDILL